jgi:transposase
MGLGRRRVPMAARSRAAPRIPRTKPVHAAHLRQEARLQGQPHRRRRAFADPAVRKSIETNLALLDHYDRLLTDLDLNLARTAKVHDVNAFSRLRSVPWIGKILALVLLYEIQDIPRFPRVQDVVSYCRLVKCAKQSDGNTMGTPARRSATPI